MRLDGCAQRADVLTLALHLLSSTPHCSFETTGFAALKADRVVEIGVVCADHSGEIVEEWTETQVGRMRHLTRRFRWCLVTTK